MLPPKILKTKAKKGQRTLIAYKSRQAALAAP
jgi:hypothetical protein